MGDALHAVVYLSHAHPSLSVRDIEKLLESARRFNAAHQVTGVLLYGDDSFFQYFEGEIADVELVYERIRHSAQHYGLLELMNLPIVQRVFPDWYMGFSEAQCSTITRLSQAQWFGALDVLRRSNTQAPGVDMLLDYWLRARQMAV